LNFQSQVVLFEIQGQLQTLLQREGCPLLPSHPASTTPHTENSLVAPAAAANTNSCQTVPGQDSSGMAFRPSPLPIPARSSCIDDASCLQPAVISQLSRCTNILAKVSGNFPSLCT